MPIIEAGHYRVGRRFGTLMAEQLKPEEAKSLFGKCGIPVEVFTSRFGGTRVKFKGYKGRR